MYGEFPKHNHTYSVSDLFYVSYNFGDISWYGCDTTALVFGQMQRFYTLNGDHREGYAPLLEKGFNACLDYFREHADQKNKRSESAPTTRTKVLWACKVGQPDHTEQIITDYDELIAPAIDWCKVYGFDRLHVEASDDAQD